MPLAALADTVVAVHVAFLVFVGLGALLVRAHPGVARLHLPALAWGVGSLAFGVECPLTGLEKGLRRAAGEAPYAGGFVDRYLEDALYPESLTPLLWVLAAAVTAWSYARLLVAQPASSRSSSHPGPTTSAPTA